MSDTLALQMRRPLQTFWKGQQETVVQQDLERLLPSV